MDILSKIRSLPGERNWSDYKLAQEADISVATLEKIVNALEISFSEFFNF